MLEVAAEYSWGQEIILIKNDKVFYPGYLNYARDGENGTSIANHSHFTRNKHSILLTFDDGYADGILDPGDCIGVTYYLENLSSCVIDWRVSVRGHIVN